MRHQSYDPTEHALPVIAADIRAKLILGFDLPPESHILRDTSVTRLPWRAAIEAALAGRTDAFKLDTPYVVWGFGVPNEADDDFTPGDMSVWDTPVAIYYIASRTETVRTTVTEARSSEQLAVASTKNMFEGQPLFFSGVGDAVQVDAVLSATEVRLVEPLTVAVGDLVLSDISSDVEGRCESVRKLFPMGLATESYRVLGTPQVAVNVELEPNVAFAEANQQLLAGMVTFSVRYWTLNRYGQPEYV